MRIAFITYEYPPDIAQGGIATYVAQAAKMFANRGHDVEIFCASHRRTVSEKIDGLFIHRSKSDNPEVFRKNCLDIFSQRHCILPFDIIESPEIHGNAYDIKIKYPAIPLVVKLHMPLFLQMRLLNFYRTFFTKARFFLGGLRKGRIQFIAKYLYKNDIDYKIASIADAIVSPSISLKKIVIKEWHLESKKIEFIPYPFLPPKELLKLPIQDTADKIVSFMGKLNVHKGIVNLVKVIPIVAKRHPDVMFKLIGGDSYYSKEGMNMSDFVKLSLAGFEKNYEIIGASDYNEILLYFKKATICIFPSIWENFGLVCLEAMSAGKPIIGTMEGGMNDILANDVGLLIDPHNVKEISNAIIKLLDDKNLRKVLGERGRKKVLEYYSVERIGQKMEEHFIKTINSSF